MQQTNFYINPIDQGLSSNKFVSIDNVDGTLEINSAKWLFDVYFYLILNANLPLNMLEFSLSLPFGKIDNVSMSQLIDQKENWNKHPHYQTFHSTFEIDVSTANFQNQKLTNYQMWMNFNFNINSDIVNNNDFSSSNGNLNWFIREWQEEQKKIDFLYSNYEDVDGSGWFDNNNTYYLNAKTGSSSFAQIVYYQEYTTEELDQPLKKILTLKTNNNFTLFNTKFSMYYQINDSKTIKKFELSDPTIKFVNKSFDICIDQKTSYDEETENIIVDNKGQEGIFITDDAVGYYELEITLCYKNNYRVFKFSKPFSFVSTKKNWTIKINQIFIKQLDGEYKQITY